MLVSEIDTMVRKGVPFTKIEDHIEELQLDEEVKACLWLYAWTRQSLDGQRAVVREMLTAYG